MIIDLPDTNTGAINKKIVALREEGGAITLGRVLTLVVAPSSELTLEESIEAANAASREHPCRVIVVIPADREAADARLDAQLRVGSDAGANEVVVLRLSGPLADHASSVVIPFLLPDTPVVTWWPELAPAVPAEDPLGRLGQDLAGALGELEHRLEPETERLIQRAQPQESFRHDLQLILQKRVSPPHRVVEAVG